MILSQRWEADDLQLLKPLTKDTPYKVAVMLNFYAKRQLDAMKRTLSSKWLAFPPCASAESHYGLILHVETQSAAAEVKSITDPLMVRRLLY